MIQIPEWQLKKIEDTLRLTSNLHDSHNKETCFDRMICKSWDWVKKALELNEKAKTYIIWNNIEKKQPLAYKSGDWDGKKSDKVLVYTLDKKYYVVEMYEGILDGNKFQEFYDGKDSIISNVALWSELDDACNTTFNS